MLALLREVPLLYRLLGTAGLALLIWGAGAAYLKHVRDDGYRAGYADMAAMCEADKAAQRKANQDAIDAVNRRLKDIAEQLSNKEVELADAETANDQDAQTRTDGGAICLPPGSVRHLNAVR